MSTKQEIQTQGQQQASLVVNNSFIDGLSKQLTCSTNRDDCLLSDLILCIFDLDRTSTPPIGKIVYWT